MARNPFFLDLIVFKCHNDSSHITKQYFAANGDRLNSQITKLLHEFISLTHFITIIRKFLLSKCDILDRLTCQNLLQQLRGNNGLKRLKNSALSYPLHVHSIDDCHFAY